MANRPPSPQTGGTAEPHATPTSATPSSVTLTDATPANAIPTSAGPAMSPPARHEWPLWEVFVRSKAGLDHKHCGSLHAPDSEMALRMARDVYTRRQEGVSIWIVRSQDIVASDPADKAMYFDPMADKVYRHPTFYTLPASVDHI